MVIQNDSLTRYSEGFIERVFAFGNVGDLTQRNLPDFSSDQLRSNRVIELVAVLGFCLIFFVVDHVGLLRGLLAHILHLDVAIVLLAALLVFLAHGVRLV